MVGSSGRGVLAERIGGCGSSRINGCGTAGMGSLMSSWTLWIGAARKLEDCIDAIANLPNFSDLFSHLKVGIYNANILEEEEKEKKKRAAKATVTEPCQTIVTHVPPQNISRSTRWCLNTCIFCTSNETFFLCPFMIHEDGSVLKIFFFPWLWNSSCWSFS